MNAQLKEYDILIQKKEVNKANFHILFSLLYIGKNQRSTVRK